MRACSLLLVGCITMTFFQAYTQDIDGSGSTHERWEYILEDTGDVLQIALPISAGIMTLIKKRLRRDQKTCILFHDHACGNLLIKIHDQ